MMLVGRGQARCRAAHAVQCQPNGQRNNSVGVLAAARMMQRTSAPFGPHTAGTRHFGTGVLFGVLVAFLVVCYVAPFLLAPIEVDFGRDLNFGYRIASGEEWVAIGPRIGTGWHVGPAWYYVLALPMLLFKSLTATVIFVAAVAALQFLLAFQIGRRMLGMRFGVAWAALLTLPGISTLQSIWVAHPSLVGVTSLATASALWNAYQRRSLPWLYTACVAFGLALHAHPTTLPLAVFFPFVFFGLISEAKVENDRPSPLWRATLCVLLVLLPFAPLLVDAQAQARSLFVFSHDVVNASAGWRDRSVSAVAANLFWHIPNLVVATFLGENSAALRMWKVFLTVLHFVADSRHRIGVAAPCLGFASPRDLGNRLFSVQRVGHSRGPQRNPLLYDLRSAACRSVPAGNRSDRVGETGRKRDAPPLPMCCWPLRSPLSASWRLRALMKLGPVM